jgi:hypothetical protein
MDPGSPTLLAGLAFFKGEPEHVVPNALQVLTVQGRKGSYFSISKYDYVS